MSVQRSWSHQTLIADPNGVAWGGAGVSGNRVVSGGGYAEPIPCSSEGTSTETDGSHASGQCPIVAISSHYDSLNDLTNLTVGYAAPPGARVRAHVFITWNDA